MGIRVLEVQVFHWQNTLINEYMFCVSHFMINGTNGLVLQLN